VLGDPASFLYRTTGALLPLWNLAAFEAAKHAIVGGAQLDALSITVNIAGQPPSDGPVLMLSLQDQEITSQPAATMSLSDIRDAVSQDLPPWAASAAVTVVDDAAGERVVTLSMSTTPVAFKAFDIDGLIGILLEHQQDLSGSGANIGRVVEEVTDSTTGPFGIRL
jgi:hypothetical protein